MGTDGRGASTGLTRAPRLRIPVAIEPRRERRRLTPPEHDVEELLLEARASQHVACPHTNRLSEVLGYRLPFLLACTCQARRLLVEPLLPQRFGIARFLGSEWTSR